MRLHLKLLGQPGQHSLVLYHPANQEELTYSQGLLGEDSFRRTNGYRPEKTGEEVVREVPEAEFKTLYELARIYQPGHWLTYRKKVREDFPTIFAIVQELTDGKG